MNLFKSAVLCVAIAVLCGCDQGQPTPPVASNPKHVATNVEDVALRESGNSIGIKFKLILAGTFTMGEHDDAHEVTLATPFKMGVREVTQAQYEQVVGVNPMIHCVRFLMPFCKSFPSGTLEQDSLTHNGAILWGEVNVTIAALREKDTMQAFKESMGWAIQQVVNVRDESASLD